MQVELAFCNDCGGSGIVHCCEGDRACPDEPMKPTPDREE